MLVPSASRAAHKVVAASCQTLPGATSAPTRTLPLVIPQRRYSSSKHSSTPKQQAAPITATPKQQNGQGVGSRKRAKSKGSAKEAAEAAEPKQVESANSQGQPEGVAIPPSVPSTAHFDPKVVHLASLFAQHRPIFLHQPVPPPDSQKSFDAIFAPRTAKPRRDDVIFTLSSVVKGLEAAVSGQPGLDGQTVQQQTIDLEALAKTFRPFNAPPAPVPMDPAYAGPQIRSDPEVVSSTGAQEMEELSVPSGATAAHLDAPSSGLLGLQRSFRERMRVRHETWLGSWIRRLRERWLAISVKRQRKLKMKKHKYKKLMRRTRNLRRRQDRL